MMIMKWEPCHLTEITDKEAVIDDTRDWCDHQSKEQQGFKSKNKHYVSIPVPFGLEYYLEGEKTTSFPALVYIHTVQFIRTKIWL